MLVPFFFLSPLSFFFGVVFSVFFSMYFCLFVVGITMSWHVLACWAFKNTGHHLQIPGQAVLSSVRPCLVSSFVRSLLYFSLRAADACFP